VRQHDADRSDPSGSTTANPHHSDESPAAEAITLTSGVTEGQRGAMHPRAPGGGRKKHHQNDFITTKADVITHH